MERRNARDIPFDEANWLYRVTRQLYWGWRRRRHKPVPPPDEVTSPRTINPAEAAHRARQKAELDQELHNISLGSAPVAITARDLLDNGR